jgi:hypothetical protein
VGLERGPFSLVNTTEELLGSKNSGSGLENREYCRRDPLRWPRGTLYPLKLALTSPTRGGRSVGIVRSRTHATEFQFLSAIFTSVTECSISTLTNPKPVYSQSHTGQYSVYLISWKWTNIHEPPHVSLSVTEQVIVAVMLTSAELPAILWLFIIGLSLSGWILSWNRLCSPKKILHGLSPQANYIDGGTAACRRSDCQLLRIEGARWSAWRIPTAVFSISRQEPLLFYQVAPQLYSRGWVDPVPDPLLFFLVVLESNPGLRICSQELWPLDHRGGPMIIHVQI